MSITKQELRDVLKEELKDFVKRDELKEIIKAELTMVHKKIDSNHQEVMELVHEFSNHVEERFQQIEGRLEGVESRLEGVEGRLEGVEGRLEGVENQVGAMLTQEYFDEQMTELRGDFVIHGARKDKKVTTVVDLLVEKKVFTSHDRKRVFGVESFE